MTATPTTTPTATSATETVTPVPLGAWVRWPDWPTEELSLEDVELRDVYFPSPDEGWAVGFGKRFPDRADVAIILRYHDGEWVVEQRLDQVRLYAIDGTGADNIWAVGKDRQRLAPFHDVAAMIHYDGETWTKFDIEPLRRAGWAVLRDVDMLVGDNGIEGWAISQRSPRGGGGYVLHFDPVEGRWEQQVELNGKDLPTIDMVDATDGWIISADESGIAHYWWYRNGYWQHGASWGPAMNAVSMADALYGLAVGDSATADEYYGECHDSPQNCRWVQHSGIRPEGRFIATDVLDIQLLSRYDGWLVGSHHDTASTVIHYERLSREVSVRTISSINWQLMEIENDPVKDLYGVHMLPGPDGWAVDGWAVGEDGAILRYEGPTPPATPTPTPTGTATSTSTATMTASPTTVPTATPSAVPSSTPTASPTPQSTRWRIHLPFLARNGSHESTPMTR